MAQMRQKILVAMSGGADSAVAAAMLRDAGHDVVGVFMCMGGPRTHLPAAASRSCCSPQDSADARAVAVALGIPFYILDFQRQFDELIDLFVSEYNRGRTPNPCVLCNSRFKFGRLFDYAATVGADAVATGHYARLVRAGGRTRLACGIDSNKDQSYVLFDLDAATLSRTELPLGGLTKDAVRAKAASLGLAVHDKPDSQEICFVPDDDYVRLIRERCPGAVQPGDVLDMAGGVIGRHPGHQHFTIGQRRGVRVATGSPAYVTRIDAAANTITLGSASALLSRRLDCSRVRWHIDPPPEGAAIDASVKIRYRAPLLAATVTAMPDSRARVEFDEPASAVTPGQAVVFYDDAGLVLGGGWID